MVKVQGFMSKTPNFANCLQNLIFKSCIQYFNAKCEILIRPLIIFQKLHRNNGFREFKINDGAFFIFYNGK